MTAPRMRRPATPTRTTERLSHRNRGGVPVDCTLCGTARPLTQVQETLVPTVMVSTAGLINCGGGSVVGLHTAAYARQEKRRARLSPRARCLPLGYVRASQARASALPNSLPATSVTSPVVMFNTTCPMTPDPVERPVIATIKLPS
jgi:hypothetical protein